MNDTSDWSDIRKPDGHNENDDAEYEIELRDKFFFKETRRTTLEDYEIPSCGT